MSRLLPYFKASLLLLIAVVAVGMANKFAVAPVAPSTATSVATSTFKVVPTTLVVPEKSLEQAPEATSTVAINVEAKKPETQKKAILPIVKAKPLSPPIQPVLPVAPVVPIAPVVVKPVVVPPPPVTPVSSGNSALDASALALRGALVNILCYAPVGGRLRSISASGIFIDPKGIILTNAHVAQYFLLADRNVSCTIRSGNPAIDKYKAALIYISPSWVRANASVITQSTPIGTGEYDFALLAVTKSMIDGISLLTSFPYVSLAQLPPPAGTPVVIASYGAQFLNTSDVQNSLYPTIVFGSVKDVFTFSDITIDVIALGGSAAAQEGSSGGGVMDASGDLVGTITTSTITGATDTRSLDAITASYIRAQYATEMASALDILLSEPVATSVAEFAPQITTLEALITAHLF